MATGYHPAVLTLLVACSSDAADGSDTGIPLEEHPFCEDYSEANTAEVEQLGDGSGSGYALGQMVQGVVQDPHDPAYVGFVDYILDNVNSGGVQTLGRTDQEGRFNETLGPGQWHIKTSGHQAA